MDLELVGKVAIVTGGASGGLGENMAVRLLEEGCRVMVADRNAQKNAELVERLAPVGEVAGHVSDVSTEFASSSRSASSSSHWRSAVDGASSSLRACRASAASDDS